MIADALKVNHTLETLELSANNIGDDGAKMIADALKVNLSLKTLRLSRNRIGADGAKIIADALKVNQNLKTSILFFHKLNVFKLWLTFRAPAINHSINHITLYQSSSSSL